MLCPSENHSQKPNLKNIQPLTPQNQTTKTTIHQKKNKKKKTVCSTFQLGIRGHLRF